VTERFYLDPPTVVRERTLATGTLEIAVYNVELRRWILAPEFIGRILGVGGDGLSRISREVAGEILAKYPPLEAAR
jgi:hypothetical protein